MIRKQPIAIDRRKLVAGAAGAAITAGATLRLTRAQSATPSTTASPAATTCMLTPELTEGPYYVANELVRQDITEDKQGVPLTLQITVQDSTSCAPLANAAIDIWHCDALGYYSGITGENPGGGGTAATTADNADTTFLRGIQLTDDQGVVTFQSIYPGWYTGRTVHIHLKAHVDGTEGASGGSGSASATPAAEGETYTGGHVAHTGQLFFDDALSDQVFALQPYATHTGTRVRNNGDNILGDHADEPGFLVETQQTDTNDLSKGLTGRITLSVDPNATPAATGPGGSQGGTGRGRPGWPAAVHAGNAAGVVRRPCRKQDPALTMPAGCITIEPTKPTYRPRTPPLPMPDPALPPATTAVDPGPRELTILNAIADALNHAVDVREALSRTLALVADLLGLRTGWVWLLDAETDQFYLAAAQNLPPYLQEPVRMSGRWCRCNELCREGKLTPTNINMVECSRLQPAVARHASAATAGLRYHASVPLAFQERMVGIINIAGPSWRELTPDELRLLSTIAYQAGVAVERARLAEEGTRLARAEERTRIAREIHDTLAQGLTAIGLDIEGALRHLESDPERARQRLERALTTARDNLEEARRSVLDLRAAPLAGLPLGEALAALGRGFTSETGILTSVHVAGEAVLPPRVESELYRIAQEALANVRRHAHATRAEITLTLTATEARLLVRDNGVGFQPGDATEGHHGLIGMRERTALLHGRMRIASQPDRGTTVTARVPLAEAT